MIQRQWLILCIALAIAASWLLRTHQGTYSPREIQDRYGDWAIVAGASEGLGASWAEHLCQNGVNVLLVARRKEALEASADRIKDTHGCLTDTLVQDLSDPNVADIFRSVLEKGETEDTKRKYGLLVYNAAYVPPEGQFLDIPLEKHNTSIGVNVGGVASLVHVFANYLRAERSSRNGGGGIILMSSLGGLNGIKEYANYAATKAWNTIFVQGVYEEFQQPGIDILACVAGATWTPNYERSGGTLADVGLQQPDDVVKECLQALGKTPSLATGPLNKFARFLFTRILPHTVAVRIMNDSIDQVKASRNN